MSTDQSTGIGLGTASVVVTVSLAMGYFSWRSFKRRQELRQLDLVGTWRDVIQPGAGSDSNRRLTKDTASIDNTFLQEILHNIHGYFNTTVEGSFRGNRVVIRVCEFREIVLDRGILNEIQAAADLKHDNILALRGLIVGPRPGLAVLYNFCAKGSLSVSREKSILFFNLDPLR